MENILKLLTLLEIFKGEIHEIYNNTSDYFFTDRLCG